MIRKIESIKDFEMVQNWWKHYNGRPLNPDCVSDYGYIYALEDKAIMALFLFPVMGCAMAMVGWPVANPESSKDERNVAFPLLLEFIEDEARLLGYDWLTTYASRSSVNKRFEEAKYLTGDVNVTQYIKPIGVMYG